MHMQSSQELDTFSVCSWVANNKLLQLKINIQEVKHETIQLKNMVKEMNEELDRLCFGTSVALKAIKQNQESLRNQIDILSRPAK